MSHKKDQETEWDFEKLVGAIRLVHDELVTQASRAVNVSLTLRNWLIGCYIAEYEQNGEDRANYGTNLMTTLSERLERLGLDGVASRSLRLYRQFYQSYPGIWQTLSARLPSNLLVGIRQTLSADFVLDSGVIESPTAGTESAPFGYSPVDFVQKLSFSHIAELLKCEDPTQRSFYEMECIQGNWSVRELKRQIGSLYYERSGLSKNKKKLSELVRQSAETAETRLAVRDPYIFEFLGLKPKEVMSEFHLEDQLLDRLQEFLLELGHGFCFEARQKRILIGDEHFFVDLVFYHRILKCHVLVELKLEKFGQENIGQLNTYVSWYRKNMMVEGDNPPVGILLCTGKNHALVEYALAGMDNRLFVSRYLLELPKKEEMQKFIEQQLRDSGV